MHNREQCRCLTLSLSHLFQKASLTKGIVSPDKPMMNCQLLVNDQAKAFEVSHVL